jgi:hypothetical protein
VLAAPGGPLFQHGNRAAVIALLLRPRDLQIQKFIYFPYRNGPPAVLHCLYVHMQTSRGRTSRQCRNPLWAHRSSPLEPCPPLLAEVQPRRVLKPCQGLDRGQSPQGMAAVRGNSSFCRHRIPQSQPWTSNRLPQKSRPPKNCVKLLQLWHIASLHLLQESPRCPTKHASPNAFWLQLFSQLGNADDQEGSLFERTACCCF